MLINLLRTEVRWSVISGEDIIQVEQSAPPPVLYHGTNTKVVHKILTEGIKPMGRKYIHLSEGLEFAALAGKRRGKLVILKVNSLEASDNNVRFYAANHGVWLADYIPHEYLRE